MSKLPTVFERRARLGFISRCGSFRGLLVVLLLLCFADSACAQSEIELKVKAAFLYNFAKFTQWPTAKLAAADPLVIGCFAEPEFFEVLESTVASKMLGARHIVVKRVSGVEDLRACHILFVSRGREDAAAPLISRAKEMQVLTVGDGDNFLGRGGMIGFVPSNGSVRFAINSQQAQSAGLTLSSKLLGLAVQGGER